LKATDRAELLDDSRFTSVAARARNVAEWFEIRGAPLTSRTTAEWVKHLRAADIAVQPVHTLDTLPHDPHLEAVGLISHEQHPTEGRSAAIRSSLRVDGAYLPLRAPAQPRGADTRGILLEMGYASDAIEALLASGAAQAPATT
jgi:crotonobetainyl-CoA:carnitine CoA-transferase CaiB-like acyl-CoA transferase